MIRIITLIKSTAVLKKPVLTETVTLKTCSFLKPIYLKRYHQNINIMIKSTNFIKRVIYEVVSTYYNKLINI